MVSGGRSRGRAKTSVENGLLINSLAHLDWTCNVQFSDCGGSQLQSTPWGHFNKLITGDYED